MKRADKDMRSKPAPFLRPVQEVKPETGSDRASSPGPETSDKTPPEAPETSPPAADAEAPLGYSAKKKRPKALTRNAPPATPGPTAQEDAENIKPIAGAARFEKRHQGILLSFVLLVLLPIVVVAAYLWIVAKDQYGSTVAFSIRREEVSSSLDLLGGISKLSGGGGSDTDILYEFIESQELVSDIDKTLDLTGIYSRAWPEDPVFAYDPDGTIEDLLRHWKRKVQITYDTGTGLMTLQVLAFDPEDATAIATQILQESTRMINDLSTEARADATRYALAEVDRAVERLKEARSALTSFRLKYQVVDPSADLAGQTGVLNNFQAQLADSLVELDLLRYSASETDPRIQQLERRIDVIRKRIVSEREKFGVGGAGPGGEDYATLVAEFERLSVDRQFAEETYRAALVGYDDALAEAKRKSLYLAAHIQPTKAERSDFPKRWTLQALASFFLLMAWSMGVLIYYSIRDRR